MCAFLCNALTVLAKNSASMADCSSHPLQALRTPTPLVLYKGKLARLSWIRMTRTVRQDARKSGKEHVGH